ncbi:MAG: hypothetical protein EA391_14490 [Balneolaceae bacterium]|nr:MAG: hypothetical protein EA391_14490 [Balneolaceae bacterium]
MNGKDTITDTSKTVLTITTALLVVYLFTGWQWTIWTGVILGVAALFSKTASGFIHSGWMKLAYLLSLIIPKILLTIIFYFILLPLALISRIVNKEPALKLRNNSDTMYTERMKTFTKEDFEKPW